jgi:hypothetical protein
MRDADPRRVPGRRLPPPGSATGATNGNTSRGNGSISVAVVAGGAAAGGGSRGLHGIAVGSAAGPSRVTSAPTNANGDVGLLNSASGAGGAAVGSAAADGVDADSGGTPTRSTPYGSGTDRQAASEAAAGGTAGRAKRPRSSASLFQDA